MSWPRDTRVQDDRAEQAARGTTHPPNRQAQESEPARYLRRRDIAAPSQVRMGTKRLPRRSTDPFSHAKPDRRAESNAAAAALVAQPGTKCRALLICICATDG